MDQSTFARILSSLSDLTPQQITQLADALTRSRRRVEAVVVIDELGANRNDRGACPRCSHKDRCRWGRTRTGAQRWRCGRCGATWCGSTGTPLARVRRPDLLIELARNMFETDTPWSCRIAAKELGISRHTAWRWRMAIIRALPPEKRGVLSGIVEADEARQRESRKGSREWARYSANPSLHPKPPREPWRYYLSWNAKVKTPPGGWRVWDRNLLAATDRSGHRAFEAIPNVSLPAVSNALLPVMASDAVLCTDGHLTYETLAKAKRIPHFALNKGRRSRSTPKTHHINTVNALISRYRSFIRPFCGPATKNLAAYGRWHAARENMDRNYISIFKHFAGANTLC